MLIFVAIAAVVFIVVLRELARRAVMVVLRVARSLTPKVTASRAWAHSEAFRFRMAERYPAFVAFVANRIESCQPTGLPLTLMILAAVYLATLFKIRLRRSDLREITNGVVEGTCAPNAEVDPRRSDQSLNLWLNQTRRRGRRDCSDRFGQAVALIDVEDREAFQEWDGTWRFARFFSTLPLVLRREAIGIDDSDSPLTLAPAAADRNRPRRVPCRAARGQSRA